MNYLEDLDMEMYSDVGGARFTDCSAQVSEALSPISFRGTVHLSFTLRPRKINGLF